MSLDALEKDLTALPAVARVEEQGRLAIVTVDDTTLLDAPTRRRLVALARTHGYSHVCVELAPECHPEERSDEGSAVVELGQADPSLRSG